MFVTGVTSALGREVCRLLAERGASVTGLVRSRARADGLHPQLTLVEGRCEEPHAYRDALQRCRFIIHVAGMHHASSIVRACTGHETLERIVFISSTRVHFPDKLLCRSELEGKRRLVEEEANVASTWLPWTILRPTLIHSPLDRSVNRFVARMRRRRLFPLPGAGKAVRQPISAGDLAVSVLQAFDAEVSRRKSYDVPGRDVTLIEMLGTIERLIGREVTMVRVPRFAILTLKALGTLWVDDRLTAACTRYLRWYEDIQRDGSEASRDFGHAPRDFAVTMREQFDSMRGAAMVGT